MQPVLVEVEMGTLILTITLAINIDEK